jgi:hypothetical protein
MCHRELGLVILFLVSAFTCTKAGELARSAEIISIFRTYEALNDDFVSSVATGHGRSSKTYAQLRKEVEAYAEGPLANALKKSVEIACGANNSAVLRSLFGVINKTSNSANESPADTLGKIFICNPRLVSEEFHKSSATTKSELLESLVFGFGNVVREYPVSENQTKKLNAILDSLASESAK